METLVEVAPGDNNVVVGISGFGSAKIGHRRWEEMARLTGRTAAFLRYDAQELPWEAAMIAPGAAAAEALKRWEVAREGAQVAARYLVPWLERWAESGRKVLIVGFSLGAYVAWEAVRQVAPQYRSHIEVILISAAVADRPETWEGVDGFARVVNVFSSQDMALRWLYPYAVGPDDTPAAGLGPLVSESSRVLNVDVTDLVGHDHLWAARNLGQLVRVAVGCLWGGSEVSYLCPDLDAIISAKSLSAEASGRLYRWAFVDPALWGLLGRALDGDEEAIVILERIDAWSVQEERLPALLNAGVAVASMMSISITEGVARRNARTLRGMVRYWISESPELGIQIERL